ncbi:MAG: antitoxin family protein [Deltaproteobacteria bacterium]|nr:antitoxin family protein [Deltaproteobacteria bacterium]
MSTIRARVRNGRLVLDEPTDLPEGTEVDLVIDDTGDDLDESERAALDTAITRAWASVQAGEGRSAADILADLTKR